MDSNGSEMKHFLHIKRKRYRKQYKELKKLFRGNEFEIDNNKAIASPNLQKYWRWRHCLFSKLSSDSIYMTRELWFSVTPELIAVFVAKFVKSCLPDATRILDVFCGGGGNTIQFAKLFPEVYGVDFSVEHLYCTYQNARTYDVSDRIWLKYGSWTKLAEKGRLAKLGFDCVFGSPPWGGPNYLKQKKYDLELHLQPIGLTEMLKSFLSISENIIMFLPKNSNLTQLSRATRVVMGINAKCKIVHLKQDGFMKGLLCIWGDRLINYAEEVASEEEVYEEDDTSTEDNDKKAKKVIVSYELDG